MDKRHRTRRAASRRADPHFRLLRRPTVAERPLPPTGRAPKSPAATGVRPHFRRAAPEADRPLAGPAMSGWPAGGTTGRSESRRRPRSGFRSGRAAGVRCGARRSSPSPESRSHQPPIQALRHDCFGTNSGASAPAAASSLKSCEFVPKRACLEPRSGRIRRPLSWGSDTHLACSGAAPSACSTPDLG